MCFFTQAKSEQSSSSATLVKKGDLSDGDTEKTRGEEMTAMDVDDALVTPASFGDGSEETKKDTSNKSISSSLSASPSSGLDCDPEVKEGFLCLSEEDDVQPEKDDKSDQSEEKMNVDAVKEDLKDEKTGGENPETQLVNCPARFQQHCFGKNSLIVMRVASCKISKFSHITFFFNRPKLQF